jgi:cytochrome c oxidase assembly factor CtaG
MTTYNNRGGKTAQRGLIVSIGIAAVVLMAAAVGAGYWWHRHNLPSQASAADCRLAQSILDEAKHLPRDKAAVEAWQQKTHNLRMSQMNDQSLGFTVAGFEQYAATAATGDGELPTAEEFNALLKKANSHCGDAKITLDPPPAHR